MSLVSARHFLDGTFQINNHLKALWFPEGMQSSKYGAGAMQHNELFLCSDLLDPWVVRF